MCGILGFNWEDKELLQKLSKIIKHRGPDHQGFFVDKVSLAHNRLSIIDLTEAGNQPMTAFGRTIIFNGEIYNYKELKHELKEYTFKSDSDTEVILAAYDKWKEKCLEKFNGMFAFCIYDGNSLFLARDRIGIKPLYYHMKEKKFIFASEIKAITPIIKKEIDEEALQQFFTYRFTLGEKTLLKDVNKLEPGYYMKYDLENYNLEKHQYYNLEKQTVNHHGLNANKDQLRIVLEKSIERRMIADVPVACLLSGGLDSSIIAALAKKHNPNLNTFSIAFDKTNELKYARIVAKYLGTKHHELKLTKNDLLKYVDRMVYHMDEPIGGDPGFLPIFVLSEFVSKHNKVVLSGDGADEILTGYDKYKLYKYGTFMSSLVFTHLGNSILKKVKLMRGKSNYAAYNQIVRLFDDDELKKLKIKPTSAIKYWDHEYKNKLANAQKFDVKTLLPNDFLMKADKMSAAFGLEQRVPFLDHELIELAFQIPMKQKLKGINEKYVLRRAAEDLLPKKILKRRKHGFDVPVYYWFKSVLGKELTRLLNNSDHNLYDKTYVHKLLKTIRKTTNNRRLSFYIGAKLWSILIFEKWYEQNFM